MAPVGSSPSHSNPLGSYLCWFARPRLYEWSRVPSLLIWKTSGTSVKNSSKFAIVTSGRSSYRPRWSTMIAGRSMSNSLASWSRELPNLSKRPSSHVYPSMGLRNPSLIRDAFKAALNSGLLRCSASGILLHPGGFPAVQGGYVGLKLTFAMYCSALVSQTYRIITYQSEYHMLLPMRFVYGCGTYSSTVWPIRSL